jgi:hypothetical protein
MAFPSSSERMPPPGAKKPSAVIAIGIEPKGKPADGMTDDAGGKESESDAIVLRGGEKTCESCKNYDAQQGTCQKVDGQFDPDDRCLRYYDAGSEEMEEAEESEGMSMTPPAKEME